MNSLLSLLLLRSKTMTEKFLTSRLTPFSPSIDYGSESIN